MEPYTQTGNVCRVKKWGFFFRFCVEFFWGKRLNPSPQTIWHQTDVRWFVTAHQNLVMSSASLNKYGPSWWWNPSTCPTDFLKYRYSLMGQIRVPVSSYSTLVSFFFLLSWVQRLCVESNCLFYCVWNIPLGQQKMCVRTATLNEKKFTRTFSRGRSWELRSSSCPISSRSLPSWWSSMRRVV